MSAIVVGYAMGAFGFALGGLVFEAEPDGWQEWCAFVVSVALWPVAVIVLAADNEQSRRRNR